MAACAGISVEVELQGKQGRKVDVFIADRLALQGLGPPPCLEGKHGNSALQTSASLRYLALKEDRGSLRSRST
eukprot:987056-Pelagomonas_calceolata.AAC.5